MPLPRLRPVRPTGPPCPRREDGRACEPLNRVWLTQPDGKFRRAYAACTCGSRFGIGEVQDHWIGEVQDHWRDHLAAARALRPAELIGEEGLQRELDRVPRADRRVRHAAPGVVPVGRPVIHHPAAWVDATDRRIAQLGEHMLAVMDAAPGIGLAANQVGAGLRLIALNFPGLVPQLWINPLLLDSRGRWTYPEGCLSLVVEGTTVDVVRPKQVTVVAQTPGGGRVIVEADELLARVVQHELDHLEGIEYVQRLDGSVHDEVYGILAAQSVDVGVLPPQPYGP
ncbi:MAG TPA: peptide deformylase [Euzebya sp.]|nr:peptide deformylase [Euzebya sp.]